MKDLHNTPKLAAKHRMVDDGSGKVNKLLSFYFVYFIYLIKSLSAKSFTFLQILLNSYRTFFLNFFFVNINY